MSRLLKLSLSRFRNYTQLSWKPDAPLLVLTGENGCGKTNLLEAVSLLAPGRGLRAAPLPQLGQSGSLEWAVSARIESLDEQLEIGTGTQQDGQGTRRVSLCNGKRLRGQSAWSQALSAVWITPQMDRLFSDGAAGRRRFLDRLVMAVSPQHTSELAAYDKAMTQRNRLLQTRFSERTWIEGLEHSMARHAVAVAAARNETVDHLNSHTRHALDAFSAMRLDIDCAIGNRLHTTPALAVEDWLREQLQALRPQDRQKGRASLGIHRADCTLTDLRSGNPASMASTGQQKALLVGLVLAHARVVTAYRGAPPVLLLDEPLVHLDATRRASLLQSLQAFDSTVMLTGTDSAPFAPLAGVAKFISVRQGAFMP
ncbi:DNA replication/repair protein RecF [Acetobacter vaccinii]|uniref:DNA replication and repair protein RecF n=1 Tax=Acetobacter vaccinii TaxID=2592655 RepID=A0A5C1YPN4_9PROT|nr:DNA replication/repair protein RecF [Acetobacter vaccinii]QEO18296.1 DNA replication/repair protein RecF [Acetobacter vaccinii]